MTSNIRYDNPNDGQHHWDHRKHLLAAIMNKYQLDFLGTQEGRQKQIEDLQQLIHPLEIIASHRQWLKERMYPSLFANRVKNKILMSGDFWLSETPHVAGSYSFNSKYPRVTTWLEVKSNNKHFYLFNAHLDHISEDTRICQIQVLCNEIEKINTPKLPIILMGDFNSSPFSRERRTLMENLDGLYDPWQKLKLTEETSHHPFDGIGKGGSRIDWILASNHFKIKRLVLEKSHQNLIYPSDHFPVYAEFTF